LSRTNEVVPQRVRGAAQLLDERGHVAVALPAVLEAFGRHPLFTFVIASLPTMVTLWVATFFLGWMAVFGVATLLGNTADGSPTTDWTVGTNPLPLWSVLMAHYAILAVPPGIGAWWFCRIARRSGRGLGWAAMSCGLVVALAYVVWGELEMPHDGLGGRMLLGIRCPFFQAGDWQLLESLGLWKCLVKQFAHLEQQLPQIAGRRSVQFARRFLKL
jgi:hypothetical protein